MLFEYTYTRFPIGVGIKSSRLPTKYAILKTENKELQWVHAQCMCKGSVEVSTEHAPRTLERLAMPIVTHPGPDSPTNCTCFSGSKPIASKW